MIQNRDQVRMLRAMADDFGIRFGDVVMRLYPDATKSEADYRSAFEKAVGVALPLEDANLGVIRSSGEPSYQGRQSKINESLLTKPGVRIHCEDTVQRFQGSEIEVEPRWPGPRDPVEPVGARDIDRRPLVPAE
jgi:hypothetical protein